MNMSLDKRPTRTLTAADLCDRCSAPAVVETVQLQGGSLLWCGHHYALAKDALHAVGATILVDQRPRWWRHWALFLRHYGGIGSPPAS